MVFFPIKDHFYLNIILCWASTLVSEAVIDTDELCQTALKMAALKVQSYKKQYRTTLLCFPKELKKKCIFVETIFDKEIYILKEKCYSALEKLITKSSQVFSPHL